MYKFDFTGKVALVTGAAEGLGKEFVQTIAEQGADVAMCDVQDEKGEATAKELADLTGKKIKYWHCNVGSEAEVTKMVSEIVAEYGKIDMLVNNAGRLTYGPIEEYSFEQWNDVIQTDLTGPWLCSREVVKQSMMKNGGGKIVCISSVAGQYGTPAGCPSYHAAKGGVLGLIKGLAVEYAQYGVLVNGVGPGTILNGGMTSRSKVASNPDTHKKGRCPLKRAGDFGELSGAVIYFLSDENSFTTGQNIMIDGGTTSAL